MRTILKSFFLFSFICICANNFSQVRDYWPKEGWQKKSLEEVGMNVSKLEEMQQTILSSMSYVDAFLIAKDGYLVYEKYFNNYTENDNHIICSSTKSVTSILIGILIKQHYINNIDQKVIDFFPEYSGVNSDPRLNLLTIEHMLSFTTGLSHTEDSLYFIPDLIKSYLSSNFVADPGTKFKYATPASQVLSGIINKTTGKNAYDFASEEFFRELGISNVSWWTDKLGYSYGGFLSYFKPCDMLKIGYLYLNHGIWNGDTIVDPDYVSICTKAHTDGGKPHNEKYGYNWWVTQNNGYDAYFAGGYGGQFIYVIPDLDLVVAITCNTDQHREDARFLINSHVVPAILNPAAISKNIIEAVSGLTVFPNPIAGVMNIRFETKDKTPVSLFITDLSGRNLAMIFDNKIYPPGQHIYNYEPDLSPGYYIIKGNLGSMELNAKMFILKK